MNSRASEACPVMGATRRASSNLRRMCALCRARHKAHARRGFSDAKRLSPKAGSADEAIAMIAKLFVAEADRPRFESEAEFGGADVFLD